MTMSFVRIPFNALARDIVVALTMANLSSYQTATFANIGHTLCATTNSYFMVITDIIRRKYIPKKGPQNYWRTHEIQIQNGNRQGVLATSNQAPYALSQTSLPALYWGNGNCASNIYLKKALFYNRKHHHRQANCMENIAKKHYKPLPPVGKFV